MLSYTLSYEANYLVSVSISPIIISKSWETTILDDWGLRYDLLRPPLVDVNYLCFMARF